MRILERKRFRGVHRRALARMPREIRRALRRHRRYQQYEEPVVSVTDLMPIGSRWL